MKLFIVVDGMDGAGKGEVINRLQTYLYSKDKRIRLLVTREPTSGRYGKEIREILANDKDPMAAAEKCLELYIKDREDHISRIIKPFIDNAEGDEINVVLCDRYYYSTIAFQKAQGIDINRLVELNKGFIRPDISFILDIEPETAIKRIEGRPMEKFESKEFMAKIRDNFLQMEAITKDNIKIIDASRSKEEVFNKIKEEIDKAI